MNVIRLRSIVRVESRGGAVWTANVTHINGRIVGLRGWTNLGRQFTERAHVALLVGATDHLVCVHAQVLSASGTLMRAVRRDDSVENERRRTPRLRVAITAELSIDACTKVGARVVDLSNSGCALMSPQALAVGTTTAVTLFFPGDPIRIQGTVVRTWRDEDGAMLAGVQFGAIEQTNARRINQLLLQQLRTSVDPIVVP